MLTSSRRRMILELLCARRNIKVNELANRFGVTARTIYNDIEKLSLAYPIYTTCGQGTGGVHLLDEYTPSQHRLTAKQITFLERLLPKLSEKDQFIAESILQDFAWPT